MINHISSYKTEVYYNIDKFICHQNGQNLAFRFSRLQMSIDYILLVPLPCPRWHFVLSLCFLFLNLQCMKTSHHPLCKQWSLLTRERQKSYVRMLARMLAEKAKNIIQLPESPIWLRSRQILCNSADGILTIAEYCVSCNTIIVTVEESSLCDNTGQANIYLQVFQDVHYRCPLTSYYNPILFLGLYKRKIPNIDLHFLAKKERISLREFWITPC